MVIVAANFVSKANDRANRKRAELVFELQVQKPQIGVSLSETNEDLTHEPFYGIMHWN